MTDHIQAAQAASDAAIRAAKAGRFGAARQLASWADFAADAANDQMARDMATMAHQAIRTYSAIQATKS